MTPEEIATTAWERAGIVLLTDKQKEAFLRFAALVAAAERDACAKVCEEFPHPDSIEGAHPDYLEGKQMMALQLARAIRARGEKQ